MSGMVEVPAEAPRDCPLCPRLVSFREANRRAEPSWHNGAVGSFGPASARLLIVGLAPGLKGANRTGRPFTGDFAGDLLYATLLELGFARGHYAAAPDDTLTLADCMITNAVRCVPPENKPTPAEIGACRPFLVSRIAALPRLAAILALGRIAHDSTLAALGARKSSHPIRAWRTPRRARGPRPLRQLPLLTLQHQHRQADAADVPDRACGHPGAPGTGVSAQGYHCDRCIKMLRSACRRRRAAGRRA